MACSKKRKVNSENRTFNQQWTDYYMVILPTGSSKAVCLICAAIIKSGNVKRHYETKHKSFVQTYPLKSEPRAQKINDLRAQYDRSTRILTHSFTAQQRANQCSLLVGFWVNIKKGCQGVHEGSWNLTWGKTKSFVKKSSKYLYQHHQPQRKLKY